MKARALLKAVLAGFGVFVLLAVAVRVATLGFVLTLCQVSFSAVVYLDGGVTGMFPWLSFLVNGGLLFAGGYVAASMTPARKVPAGWLLGLLMAALFLPTRFPGLLAGRLTALRFLVALAGVLAVPPMGACLEKLWLPRRRAWNWKRGLRILWAYCVLPLGLAVPILALLVLALYPGTAPDDAVLFAGEGASRPFAAASQPHSVALCVLCGIGVLLTVGALAIFVKARGWRRGLARNWYVWLVAACTAVLAVAFVRRNSENRTDPNLRDPLAGELNADLPLASAMGARARLLAGEGRVGAALTHLDASFRMGTSLMKTSFTHFAAGRQCRSVALAAAGEILQRPDLSRDELEWIAASLAAWCEGDTLGRRDWERIVRAELSRGLEETFWRMRRGGITSFAASQLGAKRALLKVQRSLTDDVLAADTWAEMMRRFEEEEQKWSGYMWGPGFAPDMGALQRKVNGIARGTMADYGWEINGLLSQRARLGMLRTLAAARLFRLDRGRLPRSWEELVPAYLDGVPQDPFSGGALKLEVAAPGALPAVFTRARSGSSATRQLTLPWLSRRERKAPGQGCQGGTGRSVWSGIVGRSRRPRRRSGPGRCSVQGVDPAPVQGARFALHGPPRRR